MKKYTLPLILSLFTLTACGGGAEDAAVAKSVAIGEVLANSDFTESTSDNLGRITPTPWACTNYPRYNSTTCTADGSSATIWSTWYGRTQTERRSRPAAPTWWQSVTIPNAGSYTLTVKVTRVAINAPVNERPGQAVTVKDGLTVIASIPYGELPVGEEVTRTFVVPMSAGHHSIWVGTALRTMYPSNGYLYRFTGVSLVPAV